MYQVELIDASLNSVCTQERTHAIFYCLFAQIGRIVKTLMLCFVFVGLPYTEP